MATEQEQATATLAVLEDLLDWFHQHPRALELTKTEQDTEHRTFATVYRMKNDVLAQMLASGRRQPFELMPSVGKIRAMLKANPDPGQAGPTMRMGLTAVLIAFYLSEETMRVLAPIYEQLVSLLLAHLTKTPKLLLLPVRVLLSSIAEDFGDAGLPHLGRQLKRAIAAIDAAGDPVAADPDAQPEPKHPADVDSSTSPQQVFELIADEVCRDGVVEDWESLILRKLAPILKLGLEEGVRIAKGSVQKFRDGKLGHKRPLDPFLAYQKVLHATRAGAPPLELATCLSEMRQLLKISEAEHRILLESVRQRISDQPGQFLDDNELASRDAVQKMTRFLEDIDRINAMLDRVPIPPEGADLAENFLTGLTAFLQAVPEQRQTALALVGKALELAALTESVALVSFLESIFPLLKNAPEDQTLYLTLVKHCFEALLQRKAKAAIVLLLGTTRALAMDAPTEFLHWETYGSLVEATVSEEVTAGLWDDAVTAILEAEPLLPQGGKTLAGHLTIAASSILVNALGRGLQQHARAAFQMLECTRDFLSDAGIRQPWTYAAGVMVEGMAQANPVPVELVKSILETFQHLMASHPTDRPTALSFATATPAALHLAVASKDQSWLRALIGEIGTLCRQFPGDEELCLPIAKGLIKAAVEHRDATSARDPGGAIPAEDAVSRMLGEGLAELRSGCPNSSTLEEAQQRFTQLTGLETAPSAPA